MKMQTAELTGDALDWAVFKARGLDTSLDLEAWLMVSRVEKQYWFSSVWETGGALLEECVASGMLIERVDPQYKTLQKFKVTLDRWESVYRADSLLVAVCRCFVAHNLGLEVDIPQEVLDLPAAA